MKKMTGILCLVMALAMIVAGCGCNKKNENKDVEPGTEVSTEMESENAE